MRLVTILLLLSLSLALGARAQSPNGDANGGSRETPRRERAPLASPEDIEPAVDVGGQRVAVIDRSASAAAAAAAASAAATAPSQTASGAAAAAGVSAGSAVAPAARSTPSAIARAATPGASTAAAGSSAPRTGTPRVLDTLDLGTTSITGNQELPKVLYIVPWKKSDLGDLVGRPVNTLLDEVLTPVDPEVFKRHLEYYEALYGHGQQE